MFLGLRPAFALMAATASNTMNVTGTVIANCTISATGINFVYDPVSAASVTASGTLTVACTKGSSPSITLDPGLNSANAGGAPSTRAMSQTVAGTNYYLGYDIRQPGTTTPWGTGGAAFVPAQPTSKVARNFSLDGVVTGGQDVPPGTFIDTVTATVNF
jgi:spore coat protein U-like protein